jgi:hypothetical protein
VSRWGAILRDSVVSWPSHPCHDARQLRIVAGIAEADETDVGGKRKRDQKSRRDGDGGQPKGRDGKAMVATAIERGGKSGAQRARTHCEPTIATFPFGNVFLESVLSTDELPAYRRGLPPDFDQTPDRYCTETACRWNDREHDGRLSGLLGSNAGRLPWKALVA